MNEKQKNMIFRSGNLFFLLCLTNSVGYIGSTFITTKSLEWYHSLILSKLTPADHYFAIVWMVLYFLMAFAGFLAWKKVSPRPFVLQLAFNLIWPFLFFYLKEPILGVISLVAMIFFIGATMCQFRTVSKLAEILMLPVFIWSIFALYLNLIVVLYNTQLGVWLGLI